MASSLDRIFAKSAYFKDDEEDTCSGSETETVPEEGEDVVDHSGESDNDYEPSAKKARSGGVAPGAPNAQKIERNPTRRPNPKVVNRNAVMARENRLRKKQHVENLEQEIARLKEQRDRDQMALRKAGKQVRKLTRERDHLKAVIANKSGIMAVLRAVREGSGLPMTSSIRSEVPPPKTPAGGAGSSCDEGFGSSPNPASEHNDLGFGGVEDDASDLFGGGGHHLLAADELLASMVDHQQVLANNNRSAFASTSCPAGASRSSFASPVR